MIGPVAFQAGIDPEMLFGGCGNRRRVARGSIAVDQVLLTRYESDGVFTGGSAGSLEGCGPASTLVATAETAKKQIPALVATEDYDSERMSQWQGGTSLLNSKSAVLAPRISDLTLCGHDPDGKNYTTAGVVNHEPAAWDQRKQDLYSLACIRGSGAEIRNVRFFYCPGIACVVARDVNPNVAFAQPFDFEVSVLENLKFSRVYAGLYAKLVDASISHCEARAWRDYAFLLQSGTKASHLHCYGGGGFGVGLESERNQLSLIYTEHCPVGLNVMGSHNLVTNAHYKRCFEVDVRIVGTDNRFALATHELTTLGYLVGNQDTSITDATVNLLDGGTAVRFLNGTRHSVRGLTVHAWNRTGVTGVAVAHQLNGTDVDLRLIGGQGVGIDLSNPPMLGVGNTIHVRTEHFQGDAVRLPSSWNRDANSITVDGKRLGVA